MKINDIIYRYFEGSSSVEDDIILKDYFSDSNNISEDLMYLKPMFDYLSDEDTALRVLDEIKLEDAQKEKGLKGSSKFKRIVISVSSLAASLLVASVLLFGYLGKEGDGKNYAWVNGQKITNLDVVNKYAVESLRLVSSEDNILENQLDSFFE